MSLLSAKNKTSTFHRIITVSENNNGVTISKDTWAAYTIRAYNSIDGNSYIRSYSAKDRAILLQ
jgi:hypothetical protein